MGLQQGGVLATTRGCVYNNNVPTRRECAYKKEGVYLTMKVSHLLLNDFFSCIHNLTIMQPPPLTHLVTSSVLVNVYTIPVIQA